MGSDCCNSKCDELVQINKSDTRTLFIVLFINLAMFFIEVVYSWIADSSALFGDSLDMLGDALVYSMSLYAIFKGKKWGIRVSQLKSVLMAALGITVITQALFRFFGHLSPHAETMGKIGALALFANLICALLLLRYRHSEINMRSTWLCSRNDVIVNLSVLLAAFFVHYTQSQIPDLLVGVGIALLVLSSAIQVWRDSKAEWKQSI